MVVFCADPGTQLQGVFMNFNMHGARVNAKKVSFIAAAVAAAVAAAISNVAAVATVSKDLKS